MGMTALALALALLGTAAMVPAAAPPGQQGSTVRPAADAQPEPEPPLGIYWKLVSVGDKKSVATPGGREPHILFHASGGVSGSDGCNTINGSYTLTGESLKVGPLMGTLMSCTIPDGLDRRFREALIVTRSWKISSGELMLLDENDKELARLERRLDQ